MKRIALLILLAAAAFHGSAQTVILDENFDVECAISTNSPAWFVYTPYGDHAAGGWQCTSTDGRPQPTGTHTPGVTCTGVYASIYHLDTSYLISPSIYISSTTFSGPVYLRFDTKTDRIYLGGDFEIIHVRDSAIQTDDTGLKFSATPTIGSTLDSSDWVTHQIPLTHYKDAPPFHLAFRYGSNTLVGSKWYLDNIRITSQGLGVQDAPVQQLPLSILGTGSSSGITLSLGDIAAGSYDVGIYDMLGRQVYNEKLLLSDRSGTYTIHGLSVTSGMYIVKLGNGTTFGTVKLMMQ